MRYHENDAGQTTHRVKKNEIWPRGERNSEAITRKGRWIDRKKKSNHFPLKFFQIPFLVWTTDRDDLAALGTLRSVFLSRKIMSPPARYITPIYLLLWKCFFPLCANCFFWSMRLFKCNIILWTKQIPRSTSRKRLSYILLLQWCRNAISMKN